jgi:hypothetical protein
MDAGRPIRPVRRCGIAAHRARCANGGYACAQPQDSCQKAQNPMPRKEKAIPKPVDEDPRWDYCPDHLMTR